MLWIAHGKRAHFGNVESFPVYHETQLPSMLASMPTAHNPSPITAEIQRDLAISGGEAEELMIELIERLLSDALRGVDKWS